MPRKPKSAIDPELKKAVSKLLKDTMGDATSSLTDKCKAVDRALKLAQIEAKIDDPGYGSGFGEEPTAED